MQIYIQANYDIQNIHKPKIQYRLYCWMTSENQTAEQFLELSPKFKLGCLLTEKQNPLTMGLSTLAKNDLPAAIDRIKQLDIKTMNILHEKAEQLEKMNHDVQETLESGGRIYICGCGATGRLSLVLETLWRQECALRCKQWQERVVSFMAGGDAALIKSIQDFQDHPQFAQQQLIQLGFKENDLLIGSTEGGQTPWVIGAVWKATQISKRKPYILYGNTDQILMQNVQRSKQFIVSPKINKINCNVGQMALAGSTRMQSTTILMHAIGTTLFGCTRFRGSNQSFGKYFNQNIQTFLKYIKETDFSIIAPLIEEESHLYKQGQQLTYLTDPYYAISILTDTTERSPTFSLLPFRNKYTDPENHLCWCNLKLINEKADQAEKWESKVQQNWKALLGGREIRGLNSQYWNKYKHKVSHEAILGFGLHDSYKNTLLITHPLTFKSQKLEISFPKYPSECRLSHHSLLKIILNNLSTLIMGRMDRYESNIMTYVKPTNYKLIDRSTRYVCMLRPQSSYEEVVKVIYDIRKKIRPDQPIVLKVIEVLEQREKEKNQQMKQANSENKGQKIEQTQPDKKQHSEK